MISAVGHEPDVTIADFVADLRGRPPPPTPAEIAVPDQAELLRRLRGGCGSGMAQSETTRLEPPRQRLNALAAKRVHDGPAWPMSRTSGWSWTTYSSGWGTRPAQCWSGSGSSLRPWRRRWTP